MKKREELERTFLFVTIENCRQLLEGEPALLRHFSPIFERIREIVEKPLKLAVLGEFSSGKSTFINRLIGNPILPTGITPVTSVVTILEYGEEEKIEVVYRNYKGEIIKRVYEGYGHLQKLQREWNQSDLYTPQEIRVFVNNEILRYFDIIDTPGFNDVSSMDRATEQILNRVNYIIWLFNGTQPGKATELQLLRRLRDESLYRDNIFGVINFGDVIIHSPEEYELKAIEINQHLNGGDIFVNYPLKIISSVKEDPFWETKFEELKRDLSEYILKKDRELSEKYLLEEGLRLLEELKKTRERGDEVIQQLRESYRYFWEQISTSTSPRLTKERIRRLVRREVRNLQERAFNSLFHQLKFEPLLEFGATYLTNEKVVELQQKVQEVYGEYLREFEQEYLNFQREFLEILEEYPVPLPFFKTKVPIMLGEIVSNLEVLRKNSRLLSLGYLIGLLSDHYLYRKLKGEEERGISLEILGELLELDLDIEFLFNGVGKILKKIEFYNRELGELLEKGEQILKELDEVHPVGR
ncbi:MAG: dynamin family protein [Campylobacterales bacterium]